MRGSTSSGSQAHALSPALYRREPPALRFFEGDDVHDAPRIPAASANARGRGLQPTAAAAPPSPRQPGAASAARTRTLRYFTDESCDVLKGALTVGSAVDVPDRPRKRSNRFNLGVFSDPGAGAAAERHDATHAALADAPGARAAPAPLAARGVRSGPLRRPARAGRLTERVLSLSCKFTFTLKCK